MHKLEQLKYKMHDRDVQISAKESGSINIGLLLSWVMLALALIILSSVWYYSYKYQVFTVVLEDLPLISKSNKVIRNKPLDPGGVIFSNQDKEVYKSLGQEKRDVSTATQIASVDSASAEIMEVISGLETKVEPVAATETLTNQPDDTAPRQTDKLKSVENTEPAEPPIIAKHKTGYKQIATSGVTHSIFAPLNKEPTVNISNTPVNTTEPIATAKDKKGAVSSVTVRLAVLDSQKEAEQEWKRLQGKHKDLLSGVKHSVIPYRTANGKNLFKLTIAGLEEQKASLLCDKIRSRKQSCIISR